MPYCPKGRRADFVMLSLGGGGGSRHAGLEMAPSTRVAIGSGPVRLNNGMKHELIGWSKILVALNQPPSYLWPPGFTVRKAI